MASGVAIADTRSRLVDAVDAMQALCRGPVAWGVNDCLIVAADALQPVIGVDIAARFRGQYQDQQGCVDYLSRLGFQSIAEAVGAEALRLGWLQIDIDAAMPGDAGVVAIGDMQGCAMMHRSGLWLVRGRGGFVALPSRVAICAFRIPL